MRVGPVMSRVSIILVAPVDFQADFSVCDFFFKRYIHYTSVWIISRTQNTMEYAGTSHYLANHRRYIYIYMYSFRTHGSTFSNTWGSLAVRVFFYCDTSVRGSSQFSVCADDDTYKTARFPFF